MPKFYLGKRILFPLSLLLLFILLLLHIRQGQTELSFPVILSAIFQPEPDNTAHQIIRFIRLPRTIIGLLTGAALGISGVLLQTVTRNPLSSPDTLGINAGAFFAVTLAAIFIPGSLGNFQVVVAFAGGLGAAVMVYAIAGGPQMNPIRLTLSGIAVSLALAAFTAALQLFYENQTTGLFLWGAGTLSQANWSDSRYALPWVMGGGIAAILLAKALDVLLLGEDVARSLGQRVQRTRLLTSLSAILLAAIAVSVVGPIGFVGLVAPHLVRLLGCRSHPWLIPGAALWGAVVLIAADIVAQAIGELPTGSVSAAIGAPALVVLARSAMQSGNASRSLGSLVPGSGRVVAAFPLLVAGLIAILLLSLLAGLCFGGISLSVPQILETFAGGGTALSQRVIWQLRLPRLFVGMLAGACLGVSGLLLQGVVRNPLAGPEIVGITSGAGLGALLLLVVFPAVPVTLIPVAAFVGAFAAFGAVYWAAWRGGITPARLALVGIAVSAFCAAGINILVVMAQLRVAQALVWLSGSTYARTWSELWRLLAFPVVLLPCAVLVARSLDLMALGEDLPRSLGLPLQRARGLAVAIAVALAAAAVSTVGTVSFVGLMAPHAARLLAGYRHRQLVPIAALFGAILVTVADTLGRSLFAPKEIPSGLVTALIGTPYFLALLGSQHFSLNRAKKR